MRSWIAVLRTAPARIAISIAMAGGGRDFWARALWSIFSSTSWCGSRCGSAPPLLYVIAPASPPGKLAARMDAFLTSHSIARARAAIDEIDEFARS